VDFREARRFSCQLARLGASSIARKIEMFVPVGSIASPLTLFFDGQPITARSGETIAACLLRAGAEHFRTTPISGLPRLPYCMIGHCFDCLVEIDGVGNRQACLTLVQDGMRVRRQNGAAVVREHAI
jgi:predicted molibdopterin-dependent oxidoreductase YjgC